MSIGGSQRAGQQRLRVVWTVALVAAVLGGAIVIASTPVNRSVSSNRDDIAAGASRPDSGVVPGASGGPPSVSEVLDRIESTGIWSCRQWETDFTWSCTGIHTNVFVVDTLTAEVQDEFAADNGGKPCLVSSDGTWFVTAYGDEDSLSAGYEEDAIALRHGLGRLPLVTDPLRGFSDGGMPSLSFGRLLVVDPLC